jgi:head-tail adaptor
MGIERFYTTGHKIQRFTPAVAPAATRDAYGATLGTWADVLTPTGKLWALEGDERLSADKDTAFSTHKFATAIASITAADRYVDPDSNTYNIKAVLPRKRVDGTGHLELLLERVT